MKKILPITLGIIIICSITTYAFSSDFKFDSAIIKSNDNGKTSKVINNFDQSYKLKNELADEGNEESEIEQMAKKTTMLLVGNPNTTEESEEDYYKRHKEYLKLGLYSSFPKDANSKSGYDETNENYRYAVASELAVPQLFNKINEIGIEYNSFGTIRVTNKGDIKIGNIVLPDVKLKKENTDNPMEYEKIDTNLILTYYFLKVENDYKLAYLYGETSDELEEYFDELDSLENAHGLSIIPSYDTNLREIYNYEKLDAITDSQIENISVQNENNIVTLGAHYNTSQILTANGFFIADGLVVTTWSFLEQALTQAQFITISNTKQSYEIEGIVTANPESDVAVIKLKEKNGSCINLESYENISEENAVVALSSKTGVGLTAQKGIITTKGKYIETSIPLTQQDQGSILVNANNGKVVGMNIKRSNTSSLSDYIDSNILKEIQDKFKNEKFENIKVVTFEEIKEQYYYTKYNDEVVKNNIPEKQWKKYSKIGNIEENIKLNLIKANYEDKIISLRYENKASDVITCMQYSSKFQKELINQGFKIKLESDDKCVYENKVYQVVIMEEFDYLIIVIVRK